MNLITRIFNWFWRFSRSLQNLGFASTIKIFIYQYLTRKIQCIPLPDKSKFYFDPTLDKVVSHFYSLGYVIIDNKQKKIKTIIDAGANIGVETARFAVHHPEAQIIAIEAQRRNFNILEKNVKNRKSVFAEFAGLWPINTFLDIESTSVDMQAFKVTETNKNSSLKSITIPEILHNYNLQSIDILKLDIEGAEYPLFTQGDLHWINKVNVFIIEIGDQDAEGMTQAIFNALSGIQFNSYLCGENLVMIKTTLDWKLKRVIGFN